jgi:hypothetical protein
VIALAEKESVSRNVTPESHAEVGLEAADSAVVEDQENDPLMKFTSVTAGVREASKMTDTRDENGIITTSRDMSGRDHHGRGSETREVSRLRRNGRESTTAHLRLGELLPGLDS